MSRTTRAPHATSLHVAAAPSTDPWLDQVPAIEEALASGTLKLVFLFGVARSGTTWLRDLLAQHPAVTAHPETHLFSEYLREVPTVRWRLEQGWVGLRRILPAEEERRAWRALVLRLLLAGVSDLSSRRAVVEKTPKHSRHASFIRELVPEAHFIYLLRDPRAVVASWKAAAGTFGSDWASGGTIFASTEWADDIDFLHALEQTHERLRVVRYEELHSGGAATLFELLHWLGLETTPEACADYLEARRFETLRAAGWSPDFLRKGRPDGWREELSRHEIARIEGIAGRAMDELGYERSRRARGPLPSLWLYRAAGRLERGAGWLAGRMRL